VYMRTYTVERNPGASSFRGSAGTELRIARSRHRPIKAFGVQILCGRVGVSAGIRGRRCDGLERIMRSIMWPASSASSIVRPRRAPAGTVDFGSAPNSWLAPFANCGGMRRNDVRIGPTRAFIGVAITRSTAAARAPAPAGDSR
jgi:hypothetical protein